MIMRHGRFGVLLLVFIVAVSVQIRVFPPMEGSDEPLHFAYIEYLREAHQLPERESYLENCTRQQSGQPPLMYWIAAKALDLIGLPVIGCDAVFDYYFGDTNNRWLLSPDPFRRDDNKTNFLPTTSIPALPAMPAALYVARGVSLLFGALAVIGAYLAAAEVFRREVWRLTAVMLFAFTPTFLHLSAYFTNDTAATAFTTLAIWQVLALLHRRVTWWRLVIAGLFIGFGGLAKVSVLLVIPALAVAVGLRSWREGGRWIGISQRFLLRGIIAAVPFLLTTGLWLLWGLMRYADPFGTGTHVHPTLNYDPPLGWWTTLRGMPDVYMTYVGLLGYANVYLRPITYVMLAIPVLMSFIGFVIWLARGGRVTGIVLNQTIVLGVIWVATFLGFLRWYRTIFDVTGRLLMPAHVVFAIATAAGLMLLYTTWPRLGWLVRASSVTVYGISGLIVTFIALQAAYVPRFVTTLPDNLQGGAFDFDNTIRLLGYSVDTSVIEDDLHTITLCWEVLQPTDRQAAYAVRYVKDGMPIATRTTVHGLGKYNSTLWERGKVFCDRLDMPIGDPLYGAVAPMPDTSYDILVVMLDVRTLDVNWQATTSDGIPVAFPVLGQVRTTKNE